MIRIVLGILILLGTVDSDCSGSCSAEGMSLSQMLFWASIGFGMIFWGANSKSRKRYIL
jgi:hypothetical protein